MGSGKYFVYFPYMKEKYGNMLPPMNGKPITDPKLFLEKYEEILKIVCKDFENIKKKYWN